ncbi:MAG: O-antigen ligase family protein [bacterium]|nr:O-antigen ligase family protein [Patescibacteria group bacterium]MDW8280000.1 O-antigen ligase family protein [bacterium]
MNTNSSLIKFAKFFLYLVPFSVLIVLPNNLFPFIGGKYYFFRIVVSLALGCVLLYWGIEDEENKLYFEIKQIFKKPLVIAVSLFVLIYVLASIFAYDPWAAFWSNFERQEGGFQMIHYWLFFILTVLLFKNLSDWTKMFWISIFSAIGVIFYGIFSAAFLPGFFGPYNSLIKESSIPGFFEALFNKDVRFQGSLGNSAYVAPYLMFIMFYSLFLWFTNKPGLNLKSLFYILLILFFGLFFVLSQTRGAFLGIIAAIIVFFIYLIFSDKKLKKIGIIGIVLFIILLGLAFYFRDSSFVKNLPGGRFLKIGLKEETAQTRFWTWQSAWRGFLERPILGWGQENFSAVFDKYFDIRHYNPENQGSQTWFDRAHSVVFDYLAETGILGLLSYIGIFATFLFFFFKYLKNENKNNFKFFNNLQLALMISIMIGYFVQNLIIFEVLPMYLNFFLCLGFFAVFLNFESKNNNLSIKK